MHCRADEPPAAELASGDRALASADCDLAMIAETLRRTRPAIGDERARDGIAHLIAMFDPDTARMMLLAAVTRIADAADGAVR
jgi:hypothetical protein